MTGSYFVNRALRKLGAIDPGRPASAMELQDGLDSLNHWVETIGLSRRLPWARRIYRHLFPSSAVSYTIGPGGNFDTTRPIEILAMNMVFNQGPNEVHLPVTLITTKEWLGIPVQLVSTSIPLRCYYDQGFASTPGTNGASATAGLGTLYFNPYPAAPLPDMEFADSVQIAQFDATTDYLFPPGWARYIECSLAVEMLEFAPPQADHERVRKAAMDAEAAIAQPNRRPPRLTADAGFGAGRGRADFNWLTGNFE